MQGATSCNCSIKIVGQFSEENKNKTGLNCLKGTFQCPEVEKKKAIYNKFRNVDSGWALLEILALLILKEPVEQNSTETTVFIQYWNCFSTQI